MKPPSNIESNGEYALIQPIHEILKNMQTFTGTVKNISVNEEFASILVEGENDSYIFHIDKDVLIVEEGEISILDKIGKGMKVSAIYDVNTPTTMSIPAQMTPKAIILNPSFNTKVIKVDESLVTIDNEYKLNLTEGILIVDNKGRKVSVEDIYMKDIIIHHSDLVTMSIPAQIVVDKIVVLDQINTEVSNTNTFKINNKSFDFKKPVYSSEGRVMVPIRDLAINKDPEFATRKASVYDWISNLKAKRRNV